MSMQCHVSRKAFNTKAPWPRNAIQDWLNLIRFDDTLYYMRSKITDEPQMDQSMLGPVLYRVAFSLDANLLPPGYQAQNGDGCITSTRNAHLQHRWIQSF